MGSVETPPSQKVFADFIDHCNGHRISTDFAILQSLREAYPDRHVTRTSSNDCDLLGYASAGHAKAGLQADDEAFDVTRSFKTSRKSQIRGIFSTKPGKLVDGVKFGKYNYSWNDIDFIVYIVEYLEPMRGVVQPTYILSARSALSNEISKGHSSVTDDLMLACGKWTTSLHEEIFVFDNQRWTKNHELWKQVQDSSWEEVILDPIMKESLIEDVQGFFDSRSLYSQFSVPWKRGIIFHGVPGNGKTISIKALMSSLQKRGESEENKKEGKEEPVPSLYVKSFEGCNGPQYSIRAIFQQARAVAPCLLIFEDLDSLVTDKIRSYFLNEVDGLESNDGILMIGSTNHLSNLDPAIANRPSRFDRKYHYKLPGVKERELYTQYWRRKLDKNPLVNFPEEICAVVAEWTEGFSFAYLKELFVMSLLTVARGGKGEEPKDPVEIVEKVAEAAAKNGGATAGDMTTESGAAKANSVTVPGKLPIPEMVVPEDLKDNLLLKVIRLQVKTLISEMDNSNDEAATMVKVAGGSGEVRRVNKHRIAC